MKHWLRGFLLSYCYKLAFNNVNAFRLLLMNMGTKRIGFATINSSAITTKFRFLPALPSIAFGYILAHSHLQRYFRHFIYALARFNQLLCNASIWSRPAHKRFSKCSSVEIDVVIVFLPTAMTQNKVPVTPDKVLTSLGITHAPAQCVCPEKTKCHHRHNYNEVPHTVCLIWKAWWFLYLHSLKFPSGTENYIHSRECYHFPNRDCLNACVIRPIFLTQLICTNYSEIPATSLYQYFLVACLDPQCLDKVAIFDPK